MVHEVHTQRVVVELLVLEVGHQVLAVQAHHGILDAAMAVVEEAVVQVQMMGGQAVLAVPLVVRVVVLVLQRQVLVAQEEEELEVK